MQHHLSAKAMSVYCLTLLTLELHHKWFPIIAQTICLVLYIALHAHRVNRCFARLELALGKVRFYYASPAQAAILLWHDIGLIPQ